MPATSSTAQIHPESVLFITLDSCRFDTFDQAHQLGRLPVLTSIAPPHRAQAPSHFTYGSHAAFWVGFTPGVPGSDRPWLNPKVGKLFRMSFAGSPGQDGDCFRLEGPNLVRGFRRLGYLTIGSGAVDWFNPSSETGSLLGRPFQHFWFSGNTWSLRRQLEWIEQRLLGVGVDQPVFLFLNIGETHVPYWHEGADWSRAPSPCRPFGGDTCSALESARRQGNCLAWVDSQLNSLVARFLHATTIVCADHGDCWGEDGLWEHGISHPCTLTVPLLLRVRGQPVI